jgi:hypothetical protein
MNGPMPNGFEWKNLTEIGGVFKFGSGVLGKSSIALGILLVAVISAIWKLHSDAAIIGVLVLGVVVFFLWFYGVLKFSSDHPDLAVLDGAEWSGWKKFEAAAKGIAPTRNQLKLTSAPIAPLIDDSNSKLIE